MKATIDAIRADVDNFKATGYDMFSRFFFHQILRNIFNLFVTSKNEFSNSPIHEFKVLQNVLEIKKQGLKCLLK